MKRSALSILMPASAIAALLAIGIDTTASTAARAASLAADSLVSPTASGATTPNLEPSGRLGAEVVLDSRTCDCCQNSAAMTSNGPIVTYRNRSTDEIRAIYVTRRVNGKWTEEVPVHSDQLKIAACPVNGPSVAAAGERVALAWFTAANDSARNLQFTMTVQDNGEPGTADRVAITLFDGSSLLFASSWNGSAVIQQLIDGGNIQVKQ